MAIDICWYRFCHSVDIECSVNFAHTTNLLKLTGEKDRNSTVTQLVKTIRSVKHTYRRYHVAMEVGMINKFYQEYILSILNGMA